MPLRSISSSRIAYSLPVRWTAWPSTVTSRLSRLSTSIPICRLGLLKPLLRRTTAWMRATSSVGSNGLLMKSSAPRAKALTFACGRAMAESITIGVSIRPARIRRTTS